MPIQVIQEPTFGGRLGEALGTGLGAGLQTLAQLKMQQLAQRRAARGLEALGIPSQIAPSMAALDPQMQREIIKNYLAGAQAAGIEQALAEIRGEAAPPVPGIGALQALIPTPPTPAMPAAPIIPAAVEVSETTDISPPITPTISPTVLMKKLPKPAPLPSPTVTAQEKMQQVLRTPRLSPEQKIKIEQLRIKKETQRDKQKRFLTELESKAWDKADPFIKEVDMKAHAAKVNNMDIDRLAALEGGVDTPAYIEFLKESGFEIPALMTPESQEFIKIRQTFMRDMRAYFGARITNFELDQFLKTIPDLSQSPQGRRRVIANLKRVNNISIEYGKALDKIIKRNKGVPPRDIRRKVNKELDKRLDVIAKQFRKDLQKPVPKWSTKDTVATAIGALTGKLLGFITGIAKLPTKIGGAFIGGGGGGE